ncbi:MAG TPA: J domain-containing protein [Thiomicrospira sp.]|nr:J domain-containing protein [Thiomicrospira sp.]
MHCKYDVSIDYFAVLGVHFDACPKTVKLAYRKMARRYHPDVSKIFDAKNKFQEMAFAYEVLSKHRDGYCSAFKLYQKRHKQHSSVVATAQKPYNSGSQSESEKNSHTQSNSESSHKQASQRYGKASSKPIDGKDRIITYPLTLRYAIRLLKLGHFYIPSLKVRMKFTREALTGKTFRLAGKGYRGLFGGKDGDYLVRFEIKNDNKHWHLKGADLYGRINVSEKQLVAGTQIKVNVPTGSCQLLIPEDYQANQFVYVEGMGLPAEAANKAGHLYTLLIPA